MSGQDVDKWKWLLPEVVAFSPCFIPEWETLHLFQDIRQEVTWEQHHIRLFGRRVASPRLSAFVGDEGVQYAYSGISMTGSGWPPVLAKVRRMVEAHTGAAFNCVLLNLYRDGSDSMGYHADDEPELGPEPVIASLSLGGVRRFRMKPNDGSQPPLSVDLNSGSLLLMKGLSQRDWKHAVPKTKRPVEARLNLTFRNVIRAC